MPVENPEPTTHPQQPHEGLRQLGEDAAGWQLEHPGVKTLYENHVVPKLDAAGLGHLVVRNEDMASGGLHNESSGNQEEGGKDTDLSTKQEAAQELRAAYKGWLERRGIDPGPKNTPHFTVCKREFELLQEVGLGDGDGTASFLIDKTRKSYGIPSDAKYAAIDIIPDDPNLPRANKLVDVREEDFGTVVDDGRLESRDIAEDIPHLTMNEREFNLFRIVGADRSSVSSLIQYAKNLYRIPQGDQIVCQYALVEVQPDGPNLPPSPSLMMTTPADFGTVIEPGVIAKDFERGPEDPNNPAGPNSGGALKTVDIGNIVNKSNAELQTFAANLMENQTADPFNSGNGDIGVRAGDLMPDQKDAYFWTNKDSRFADAVALTLLDPVQYSSVCIIQGEKTEAANSKFGMAQMKDPTVVLKIEGEDLRFLQDIYKDLYEQPDFALTDEQKRLRNQLFNEQLTYQLSYEATHKPVRQKTATTWQQPKARERELPDPYR